MTEDEGGPDAEEPATDSDKLAEELGNPVEDVELTPEEEDELRRSAARIRKALNPQVQSMLSGLQQGNGLSPLLRHMDKWKRVGLADSVLKRALGNGAFIKSITAQRRIDRNILGRGVLASSFPLKKSLLPKRNFEQPWVKQMKFINSDIYKLSGVGQGNLTAINSILAKNADFGFRKTTPSWVGQFAKQQNSWLKSIAPAIASFKFDIYPSNLQHIEGLRLEDVEEVVMIDGIALYGVPRSEIAEKLIMADSVAARREILGRRWKAIAADCRIALEGCASSSMTGHVAFAEAALDALDVGNSRAAQALAASILDTVVNGYFGEKRRKLTPSKKNTNPDEYDEFTVREFIAFAPMWQAYQQFYPNQGDRIPTVFNRHASVHGVSNRQYSRRNAVQALLFVCSLLLFLDEEATSLEAA